MTTKKPNYPTDGLVSSIDIDAMCEHALVEWYDRLFAVYGDISDKYGLSAIEIHYSLVSLEKGYLCSNAHFEASEEMYREELGHTKYWSQYAIKKKQSSRQLRLPRRSSKY